MLISNFGENLFIRTFSSKIANNKPELLRIIQELSEEVADELLKENLEVDYLTIL